MQKSTSKPLPKTDFQTIYNLHLGLEFKNTLRQHYCMYFDYSKESFRVRMQKKIFSKAEKDWLYNQLKSNASHITKNVTFEQMFDCQQLELTDN